MRSLRWGWVPLGLTFAFLYLPIVVLVVMSFNASDSQFRWSGFSVEWYGELAGNQEIRTGLGNTLVVAIGATAGSVVLGTLLAIGLHRYLRWSALDALTLGPAIAPDIVMAIGLLALYVTAGVTLGLHTVLLSHIVFGTAFVAAVVKARLGHTDPSLEEASLDLGATPLVTFFRVTVPTLLPAIVAGGLLVFTLSLDEFVIAFFTNGPATPTLPLVIYSMLRFGLTPQINALAALLLVVSFTAVIAAQRISGLGGSDE
ncbi:MAG: ABC transporter permease [Hyphomicrobium sp.]|nr:ABC transporter permease [Hyphomicrobium sp.]